jgi:hypothetical protein
MSEQLNNYGKLLFFFYLDENNKYIKNDNIFQLKQYYMNNNCVLYFENTHNHEFNEINYCKTLDYNISYDDFPWEAYLYLNNDLNNFKTKDELWYHWKKSGKKEERTYSYINNSSLHQGRFGNIFFINMFLHFISIKNNLKCYYKNESLFNQLGIFFNKGENEYETNCVINDKNFLYILKNKIFPQSNVILKNVWFHTKEFCTLLKTYFEKEKIKNKIIEKNIYKNRYNNNNDLFIHIRLGDVTEITSNHAEYYSKLLNIIDYDVGFISSDTITHPLCVQLISKYKLKIIDYNEVNTIMFASTCKNIILSGGTFSWLIGFLAFDSECIYYPDIENKWYGEIFTFSNWNKISNNVLFDNIKYNF